MGPGWVWLPEGADGRRSAKPVVPHIGRSEGRFPEPDANVRLLALIQREETTRSGREQGYKQTINPKAPRQPSRHLQRVQSAGPPTLPTNSRGTARPGIQGVGSCDCRRLIQGQGRAVANLPCAPGSIHGRAKGGERLLRHLDCAGPRPVQVQDHHVSKGQQYQQESGLCSMRTQTGSKDRTQHEHQQDGIG